MNKTTDPCSFSFVSYFDEIKSYKDYYYASHLVHESHLHRCHSVVCEQGVDEKTKRTKGTWKTAFATAATAEEEGEDPVGRVVAVVVVAEVSALGRSRTATTRRLRPALIPSIGRSTPGLVARNNNRAFKNQKWVSVERYPSE